MIEERHKNVIEILRLELKNQQDEYTLDMVEMYALIDGFARDRERIEKLDPNPNFGELMADLRLTWERWGREEQNLRDEGLHSKASTKRLCMEDIERLFEKYE